MSYIGQRKTFTGDATNLTDTVWSLMTTAGWTQYDSFTGSIAGQSSQVCRVFTSRGEAGNYAPIYVAVFRASSNPTEVRIALFLYWNAVAHTGSVTTYLSAYAGCHYGDNFIAVSKDLVLVTAAISNGYRAGAGFVPNPFHTVLTSTTSSVSSGSSVTIPLTSSSGFKIGNKYQIVGSNSEGREQVTVNSVPDSTSIVVAQLVYGYASGSYIGNLPCPAGLFGRSNNGINEMELLNKYSISGTTVETDPNAKQQILSMANVGGASQNLWPDYVADDYVLGPAIFASNSTTYTGNYGYSNQNILASYNSASYMDAVGVSSVGVVGGAVSSGGSNTLTVTGASWTTNQWQNKWVVLVGSSGNQGYGQSRKISSNTSDTLTLDANWTTIPNATSYYRIVDSCYRYIGHSIYALETQDT